MATSAGATPQIRFQTDINGDFLVGKREIPDGFMVAITPKE